MEELICKKATTEEMEQNWKYLIETHPNDNRWKKYKEEAIKNQEEGKSIVYYGIKKGQIISEATAIISKIDAQKTEGLIDEKTAYLSAFRTRKEHQGKGYFSKLYKFMEEDLIKQGYTTLTIGVEPKEVKNMQIYFKYGFTNYIKTENEIEPPKKEGDEPKKYIVNYYSKNIKETTDAMYNPTTLKKGKIIAICGKICSGKTYYANQIKEKQKAIILSTDEVTKDLIDNEQGEFYDKFCPKVNAYLMKKSIELTNIGCNVILDWGFWAKKIRKETTQYYKSKNVNIEWHYIDIKDEEWENNIEERNKRIEAGKGGADFYVDEGLKKKILEKWEKPEKSEIDVWNYSSRK